MAEKKAAKRYFIVNPGGAVHEVNEADARWRLGMVGYRKATKAEIDEYLKRPIQRFDDPIAEPFNVEPEGVEL